MIAAAAVLVAQCAAVSVVAVRVARRIAPEPGARLDRALLAVLASIVQIVAVLTVLGALGVLRREWVVAVHVVIAAIVLLRVRPAATAAEPGPAPRHTGAATVALAVTVAAGAWFGGLAAILSVNGPSIEVDTAHYHLPNAAYWMAQGELWSLPPATPGFFTSTYPSNGELVGLWAMLPTHDDRLVYATPLLFGVLGVLAAALVARELGGRTVLGAAAAIAVLAAPVSFHTQVHSLMVDWAAAAPFVAGVALALVARRRGGDLRWVFAAALAIGLSVGAKYPALLPGAAAALVLVGLQPRARWPRTFGVATVGAASMTVFWFVRTWVATGNPVFPQGLTLGGREVLTAGVSPLRVYETSLLEHMAARRGQVLDLWFGLARDLVGPALVVILIGGAVAVWYLARHRTAAWLGVTVALAAAGIGYLATPFTGGGDHGEAFLIASQIRYALPVLLLAAGVAGVARPWLVAGAALVAGGFGVVRAIEGPGFRTDLQPSPAAIALASVFAAVVAAVAALMAWRGDVAANWAGRAMAVARRGRAVPVIGVTAVVTVVAVGVVAVGLNRLHTPREPPALREAVADQREPILLVGVDRVRPLLGQRLGTRWTTVGAGGAAGEIPIEDTDEFDRRIDDLDPPAIVVHDGPTEPPDGWRPAPDRWRHAGSTVSGEVYLPR